MALNTKNHLKQQIFRVLHPGYVVGKVINGKTATVFVVCHVINTTDCHVSGFEPD